MLVSIDVETTGLDTKKSLLLSVGGVAFDGKGTEWATFYRRVAYKSINYCEPRAMLMNVALLESMDSATSPGVVASDFVSWLESLVTRDKRGNTLPVTVVGKNYGSFDHEIICNFLNYDSVLYFKYLQLVGYQFLDVGSLYYKPGDLKVPSLQTCLERAGMDEEVKHNALSDARCVALLTAHYYGWKVNEPGSS